MGEASLNFSNVVKLHEDAAVDILPVIGENIDYGIEVGLPFLSPSIERDSRNVPVERVLARIREKRSVLWIACGISPVGRPKRHRGGRSVGLREIHWKVRFLQENTRPL